MPMNHAPTRRPRFRSLAAAAALAVVAPLLATVPQDPAPPAAAQCTIDLRRAGQMADIVSNALMRGLGQEEGAVREFLDGAHRNYDSGGAVLVAAARHFGVGEAKLRAEVERFRHVNCTHEGGGEWRAAPDAPFELTPFASDVTLHVVLHELAHALVREFDLPVLGNEETLADAFATCYVTAHLPDRAFDVIQARTRSLMIEAGEVPRGEWTVAGEHDNDARRAFQIAALAVAADVETYRPIAVEVGLTERDIDRARDYGTEIHRSWRRILGPLWMPEGMESREARFVASGGDAFERAIRSSELASVLESTLRRFDWHSQVTIRFEDADGGAGWSRSKRAITVNRGYIERFVAQGRLKDSSER